MSGGLDLLDEVRVINVLLIHWHDVGVSLLDLALVLHIDIDPDRGDDVVQRRFIGDEFVKLRWSLDRLSTEKDEYQISIFWSLTSMSVAAIYENGS